MSKAIERVALLSPAYARAVQQVIASGNPHTIEVLVRPVDLAREQAAAALLALRTGSGCLPDAVETQDTLALRMLILIRRAR
ncbi:MAG TPA: hypothetical protein VIF09_10515 [Polyangiaceae bacterium]